MKVKLLQPMSNMPRGAIADMSDYEAGNLIESGRAVDASKVPSNVQPDDAKAQAPWLNIIQNRSMNKRPVVRK